MRRLKLVAGFLGGGIVLIVVGLWVFDYFKGRPIERCFQLQLGMTRSEVETAMKDPPIVSKEDGRTRLLYPLPILYDTSPQVSFDDSTNRAIEIICAEHYRLRAPK